MLSSNALELVGVLSRAADVDLVLVHLNLKPRWQEGVEPHYQVWVALEEVGHTADHPRRVDAGGKREYINNGK